MSVPKLRCASLAASEKLSGVIENRAMLLCRPWESIRIEQSPVTPLKEYAVHNLMTLEPGMDGELVHR